MGSRHIHNELIKKGYYVNCKRIVRIISDMGIGVICPKPRTTVVNKAHKVYPDLLRDIEVTYPNQAWAIDITFIPMAKEFLYLVAIIDWYSCKVLCWRLSNTMDTSFCIEVICTTFAGLAATLVGNGIGRFAYIALMPVLIQSGWFSSEEASILGAATLIGYGIGKLIYAPRRV